MTFPTRRTIDNCTACPLAGRPPVPGEGLGTDVMIIGEAPGEYEEMTGRPFVGKSGKLLRDMIQESGLASHYITNRLKHRPPNNRDPEDMEIAACQPYLEAEIATIQPKAIVLVGRFAAWLVFPAGLKMGKMHGRWGTYNGIPAVGMYHPSFMMRKSKQEQRRLRTECVGIFQQAGRMAQGLGDEERVKVAWTPRLSPGPWTVDVEANSGDPRKAIPRLYCAKQGDDVRVLDPHVNIPPGSVVRCHHSQYDATVLARYGTKLYDVEWDDTKLVAHVGRLPDTSMKGLASRILGRPVPSYVERFGDPANILDVPFMDLAEYCGDDVVKTDLIWDDLKKNQPGWVWDIYNTIERPLLPIVAEMTAFGGFRVDHAGLAAYQEQQSARLYHAVRTFRALTGTEDEPCPPCSGTGRVAGKRQNTTKKCPDCGGWGWSTFNLNSDAKMAELLFEKLNLPKPRKKTPSGARYSVDESVLAWLAAGKVHPAITVLRRCNSISKEMTTYITKYLGMDRVTSEWDQCGTETGRFASRDENLQNQPEALRHFMAGEEDEELVSGDYSQIEYRVAAHLSQDPVMLDAYRRGEDMHDLVAQQFGVERRTAKVFNFGGLLFGGTENTIVEAGMKKDVIIPRLTARRFLSEAREKFTRFYDWCDEQAQEAMHTGWVTGLFGRQYYIDGWDTAITPKEVEEVRRRAVNYPIQGGAADIVKRSMTKVRQLGRPILAQVHDEITCAVPRGWGEAFKVEMEKAMVQEQPLSVPVFAEVRVGRAWK